MQIPSSLFNPKDLCLKNLVYYYNQGENGSSLADSSLWPLSLQLWLKLPFGVFLTMFCLFLDSGVLLISLALCADAAIGNVQEKAMKLHGGSNSEMVFLFIDS